MSIATAAATGSRARPSVNETGEAMSAPHHRPQPACPLGYTFTQLLDLLGLDRLAQLQHWRETHHSLSICDGEQGCEYPHGHVVSESDLDRFLAWERR